MADVGAAVMRGAGAMRLNARVDGVYSRAERLSDAAVHITGITIALIAVPVLIILSMIWVSERHVVVAAGVYGLTLVALMIASACYHMIRTEERRERLRRLDQSAIYLKIAGAYTPFAVMAGPQAMPFLAGLWAVAIAGVSMKLLSARRLFGVTVALYLAMGWAAMVFGGPVLESMSPETYRLVLVGGMLYTIGVAFLVFERLPFHNTIWHVFVLTASLMIYAAVLMEVSHRAVLV